LTFTDVVSSVSVNLGAGGNDSLTLASGVSANSVTVSNIETVTGGTGPDNITIQTSSLIYAGAGSDRLIFGSGELTLTTNSDAEFVLGSSGNDAVTFTAAIDGVTFASNGGNDTINLSTGVNTFSITADSSGKVITVNGSGSSNDNFTLTGSSAMAFAAGTGVDVVTGGSGADTFTFAGGALTNADTINGGLGTDTIIISSTNSTATANLASVVSVEVLSISGNDAFTIQALPASGLSSVSGDATNNSVVFTPAVSGMTVDLGTGNDSITLSSSADNATFINVETLVGGGGNDVITIQGNVAVVLTAGSGVDLITGGNGADYISGAAGADTIYGGLGNDTIRGGCGADFLFGGGGCDVFVFASGESGLTSMDTILQNGFTVGAGNDLIVFHDGGLSSNLDTSLMAAAVDVSLATTLIEAINLASSSTTADAMYVKWFHFNGDTYIIKDFSTSTTFVSGTDQIVKIIGLVTPVAANIGFGG